MQTLLLVAELFIAIALIIFVLLVFPQGLLSVRRYERV